jgi:ABC-type dipeptide/oligopeptide/nickel transport system permease subunit
VSPRSAEPHGERAAPVARSPIRLAWMRLGRDRVAIVSAATIAALVILALAAPLVAHLTGHGPDAQYRDTGLTPDGLPVGPSRRFLLGTDNLGRDLLVRILYGARVSLLVGVVSTVLAVSVGAIVGVVAGYLRGAVDTFLGRFMTTMWSNRWPCPSCSPGPGR